MPTGDDIRGWPILHGRGFDLGYTYIVAPRSFTRMQILNNISSVRDEMAKFSPGSLDASDRPTYQLNYVSGEDGNHLEFTLIFREVEATKILINETSQDLLLDKDRRPILITEGIVFNGRDSIVPDLIPGDIWQSFERQMIPYYSQYYFATQRIRPFIFDKPVQFHVHGKGKNLNIHTIQLQPRPISGHLDWEPVTEQEIAREQKTRTSNTDGAQVGQQDSQDEQAAASPPITRGPFDNYIWIIGVLVLIVLIIILLLLTRYPSALTGS